MFPRQSLIFRDSQMSDQDNVTRTANGMSEDVIFGRWTGGAEKQVVYNHPSAGSGQHIG